MFLINWFDLYLASFSPSFCFAVWLLSYVLYSLRVGQRITRFSLPTNIQREAAKWNDYFSSESSHISRYVLFKHIGCNSKLNGTVEACDLNKDLTLWPSYPCTLEAGHQNSFSALLSFKPEHGALHLGAEEFHYGFVFVDQLHHCDWWSQHRLTGITESGPACGRLRNLFYHGHFPILVHELAGKSLWRADQSYWGSHSRDIRLASDCVFLSNVAMKL